MTYVVFHALLIVPPLVGLAVYGRGRGARRDPRALRYLGAIAVIAFVYTTPWDNYLVWRGVWGYGEERVLGTIGYVPVEEYLFFVLQPLLTGLWLYLLPEQPTTSTGTSSRWMGAAVYTTFALCGVALLFRPGGEYLGLILAWAAPVLALQWAYAGHVIWAHRRRWLVGFAVPTVYLWGADAIAIGSGVWTIAERFTLGAALGPLPFEEAVFFLVTNLLVVQGLLLFLHPPGPFFGGGSVEMVGARPATSSR